MSLLTVEELRLLVASDLDDAGLQEIIDREEGACEALYGAVYDGTTTVMETLDGGLGTIWTQRKIGSVASITEATTLGGAAATLSASEYSLIAGMGKLTRLSEGRRWGRLVTVTYVPADDRATWKQVIIDLIRLTLNREAYQAGSVAGEYSYTAPDWESERKRIMRRLALPSI